MSEARARPLRLTFRKAKRERLYDHRYEVVLGGEIVGSIQYATVGRWYWYTLGWKEYRNTITIQGSAVDLDGCKEECKRFFSQE